MRAARGRPSHTRVARGRPSRANARPVACPFCARGVLFLIPLLCLLPALFLRQLADLVQRAQQPDHPEFVIYDCRFPFEFDGGHIVGARHLMAVDADAYFRQTYFHPTQRMAGRTNRNLIIIFHCEFSQKRGPTVYVPPGGGGHTLRALLPLTDVRFFGWVGCAQVQSVPQDRLRLQPISEPELPGSLRPGRRLPQLFQPVQGREGWTLPPTSVSTAPGFLTYATQPGDF